MARWKDDPSLAAPRTRRSGRPRWAAFALRSAGLFALAASGLGSAATALAAAVDPQVASLPVSYWRQPVFFIPYQASARMPLRWQPVRVELLMAHGGAEDWSVLQAAEPTVRGFSFHAPADGQYDFAVRLVDRRGEAWPEGVVQPQLRVVVDSQRPALTLAAAIDAESRLAVRYEATDAQLLGESLRLELSSDGKTWQPMTLAPADVRQPDRVIGRWVGSASPGAASLHVRGVIEDRAGNRTETATTATRFGDVRPDEVGPALAPAMAGAEASNPFAGRQSSVSAPTPIGPAFPSQAPSLGADLRLGDARRTPAKLVSDAIANAAPPLIEASRTSSWGGGHGDSTASPSASWSTTARPGAGQPGDGWTSPGAMDPADAGERWVNSLAFDVDYDVQSAGPWGVAKVELWATRDGGRTWQDYGADEDNRGPMRVTAPADGVYGFRIVVDGANNSAAPRPQPGDAPEIVVGVDLQAPRVQFQSARLGDGELANHLVISWSAEDDHLDARPVGVFFSEQPAGPWMTIATDLANSGQYAWQLLRTVPEQVYLRIDVRDRAGNVSSGLSPGPISLNLPQPRGRIRSIRPAAAAEQRYRTASGAP